MPPIEPSNIHTQPSKPVHEVTIKVPNKRRDSTVTPEASREDCQFELNLRPNSFDEYIGQERLKRILRIGIEAAIKRGDRSSMGHIMLYGPPGLGKTTCAFLLANLLGSKAHIFSAPSLEKPKDIVGVLMSLQEGDVLFLDEIHRLNKVTEELLYPAMEDFSLDLSTGKGVSARVTRLPLPKFILLGATTKLGNISAPLRDRFTHLHRMEFYEIFELKQIALRTATLLRFDLLESGAEVIALRSRGTPRITNRLCRLVRDFLSHKGIEQADAKLAEEALNLFQIDGAGLDHTDRALLRSIAENYGGGPVGIETLAVTLGEDVRTLEDYYEPYLIQNGFLERTSKGRKVTAKGWQYLGLRPLNEGVEQLSLNA